MPQATFFLEAVVCKDEMGGRIREKFGNDEIWMGAIGIDSAGRTIKVPFFEVYAHFDDGDVKTFSPAKQLVSLRADGSCRVMLFLADKQYGGMNDALDSAHAEAASTIARMKADGQDPTSESSKEDLIAIAGEVLKILVKEARDKVFPAQVVGLSPNPGVVDFRGHDGHYAARYHWQLA